jgi:acid stress chaperone HdeB
MKTAALFLSLVACASTLERAHAQVTLDLAQVTCIQWSAYKITNPQNIALWLSGYHNGKLGNTRIDTQGLLANVNKLRDFCIVHPEVPVMQAVEKVFLAKE